MGKLNNIVIELADIPIVGDVAADPNGRAYDALCDEQVVEVLTDSGLPLEDQLNALETTLYMLRKST